MKVRKIQTHGFRNLSPGIVVFSHHINCVFGKNASGKTNLLEAIFVLCHKKSFRKDTGLAEMIGIDSDAEKIIFRGLFEKEGVVKALSLKMESKGSQWSLDGKIVNRRPEIFYSIFVNPFDFHHFYATPGFRRNWMDGHLSSLCPDYRRELRKYNKFLKFKNNLLRTKGTGFREQIAAINGHLASASFFIEKKREQFLKELNPLFEESFRELFNAEQRVEITLESKLGGLDEIQIDQLFRRNAKKEEEQGRTLWGIHLDNYRMLLNGMSGLEFCSLGQQKIGLLALVFAAVSLFKEKRGQWPILLIDDVSGELDRLRWSKFISYMEKKDCQVVITTANEAFRAELLKHGGVKNISVEDGVFRYD